MAALRPGEQPAYLLQGDVRGYARRLIEQKHAVVHTDWIGSGLLAIDFLRLRRNGIIDKSRQAYATLDRLIVDKVQVRNNSQFETLGQLGTQESRCMQQTAFGLGNGLGSTECGEEHLGVMMIAADLDASERDHADPGILDLRPYQFGEILLNLVADPAESGGIFRHLPNR